MNPIERKALFDRYVKVQDSVLDELKLLTENGWECNLFDDVPDCEGKVMLWKYTETGVDSRLIKIPYEIAGELLSHLPEAARTMYREKAQERSAFNRRFTFLFLEILKEAAKEKIEREGGSNGRQG